MTKSQSLNYNRFKVKTDYIQDANKDYLEYRIKFKLLLWKENIIKNNLI